jgi:hypothetical protein
MTYRIEALVTNRLRLTRIAGPASEAPGGPAE